MISDSARRKSSLHFFPPFTEDFVRFWQREYGKKYEEPAKMPVDEHQDLLNAMHQYFARMSDDEIAYLEEHSFFWNAKNVMYVLYRLRGIVRYMVIHEMDKRNAKANLAFQDRAF